MVALFEINGSTPNFSRRIGPHLSDGLGNDQIFPAFDETERVGLLYRDLLGAGLAGMWSVDALIAEIGNRSPHFIAMSRLLADRDYRVNQLASGGALLGALRRFCGGGFFFFFFFFRLLADRDYRVNQLREWLVSARAYGALTDEDIETLSNDPPLPFFILFEAMQQTEGLQLGLLGSIIVSEVIFGALASDPRSAAAARSPINWISISHEFYLANVLQDIPEISSMAQLVEFTTEIADLRQAVPAFL